MIEVGDFIKLFCIFNAKNYESVSECIAKADEFRAQLAEDGEFDSDCQSTHKDFLSALKAIKDAIEEYS